MFAALARGFLALFGWKVRGAFPDVKKMVAIGAPHTSNWDFVLFLPLKVALHRRLTYLGKDSLFKGPFGWFFRWAGGIPVARGQRLNAVEQAVEYFKQRDELILVMSPEGTRKKTEAWRSGFYHIARGANVPVALGYVDYGTKTAGIGPTIMLTGDQEADMAKIRDFYRGIKGLHPEQFSTIRLELPAPRR
jgi:1-acyl-sn-glycerol-3-phosphate acyltransferase